MKISDFDIGGERTFVIAEIGNNHNGSYEMAVELIDRSIAAGADCVKFQMRRMNKVYREKSIKRTGDDLSTEYVLDLLGKFELSLDQHCDLKRYCDENQVAYMCTPWDEDSASILDEMDVLAFKVASADFSNWPLLRLLTQFDRPMILSTGMSTHLEIEKTTQMLNELGADFALLHCNSTYPAPLEDINLRFISELLKMHHTVGYSGHERGWNVSVAAVTLGARIVERHITLDRLMEGPDHAASLEPEQFAKMVSAIREIESALGTAGERKLSQGELINRENLGKSLVCARALKVGDIVQERDILVRSPGQGLPAYRIDELVGTQIKVNKEKEDFFFESDLSGEEIKPRDYRFNLPWGIPVRYHDFARLNEMCSPDLWEFHLSYSDMDLDVSDFLEGTYPAGFVVHAPELFKDSMLMDLATEDTDYLEQSLVETQRVIDITRELKQYFPGTERPKIVANIGGFSMDAPVDLNLRSKLYDIFAESLERLDLDGVELIPQNMAPFPWHFGGQRYQNLFMDAAEISNICKKLDMRICLDVSHAKMFCNHNGADFYEYADFLKDVTAHLHLGDAKGTNGEGLQIGEGEIDFSRLGGVFKDVQEKPSFIPEIWQGHKNKGEGFWIALDRLEETKNW
jgi:sialic acid synthase SpsE/sugar phosphate isomerase/epimerase